MESEKVKDIKKALECCGKNNPDCDNCPYSVGGGSLCRQPEQEALTLINELEKENKTKNDTIIDLLKKQEFYETEKLKQFAERLKEKIQNCSGCYIPDCFESPTNEFAYSEIEVNKAIDKTLKEFLNK